MADLNRPANATRKPSRTVLSTSNLWRQKNEIRRSVRQAEACSVKTCRSSREFEVTSYVMVKKVIPFPQKVAAPEVIVSRRPRMISVLTASFPGPANWMTGEFLTPPDTVGAAIVHRAILRFVSETILPTEISPQDIQRRIDAGEPLVLIDVREPEEFAITRIEGATLIPMRNIPASLQQLEAKAGETTLIVFCHHGVRSLNVVHWLREQGVPACQSMAGGIDAWSVLVDPSVPRY